MRALGEETHSAALSRPDVSSGSPLAQAVNGFASLLGWPIDEGSVMVDDADADFIAGEQMSPQF